MTLRTEPLPVVGVGVRRLPVLLAGAVVVPWFAVVIVLIVVTR